MKKSLFFLIFIYLGIISGYSIELNYPQEASLNEELVFSMELIDFPSGIYDVKIDLLENNIRLSKIIDNEKWKSTFYYINQIIQPGQKKDFILKIEKEFNKAEANIRIRSDSGTIKVFDGYFIEYKPIETTNQNTNNEPEKTENQEQTSQQEEPENNQEKENLEKIPLEQSDSITNPDSKTISINQNENSVEKNNLEKIVLNTKDIKTKNYRDYSIEGTSWLLGMVSFLLFIVLLLMLKKEKKENGIV